MNFPRSAAYATASCMVLLGSPGLPPLTPEWYRTSALSLAGALASVALYFFICERRPGCWLQRMANVQTAKAFVAGVLGLGVGFGFLWRYPFPTSLAWPGLVLARLGVPHSWLLVAVLIPAGLVWLTLGSRRRAWWKVVVMGLVVPAAYCAGAFLFLARMPVPPPASNPYEAAPAEREAYRQTYELGFREGMAGSFRTYCFRPEAETRGYYEGSFHGSEIWYRMWGRHIPESHRRLTEISAALDHAPVHLPSGDPSQAESPNQRPPLPPAPKRPTP